MPAYDPNNPFAKILRREFPCHKVYEDEHVLAFLDIMPRAPGHTLVIPKAPARNILDITPDDFRRDVLRLFTSGVRGLNITLPFEQEPGGFTLELRRGAP